MEIHISGINIGTDLFSILILNTFSALELTRLVGYSISL